MDDPQVNTGSVLQLRCQRCGHVNIYKRKVVPVDLLNDARTILTQLLIVLRAFSRDLGDRA